MQGYLIRKIFLIIFPLVFLKFGFFASNIFAGWTTTTLDTDGYVGSFTSIAVDTSDAAHISYYDVTNHDLKYATNASGSWVTSTLDSGGNVGQYTSVAVDTSGTAHISYYDVTNHDLKYATNASGSWVISTLDSDGNVGQHTSIAVDTSDAVHISYYDYNNGCLKYATNSSGSWVTTILDGDGNVGRHTSIAVDTWDAVHISYYDYDNGELKYATNASGSWVTSTLDSDEDLGRYTSITVDTSGAVHISYYDYDNGELKYATNASGTWVTTTLDSNEDVGRYTSAAISISNTIYISYYDATNVDLKCLVKAHSEVHSEGSGASDGSGGTGNTGGTDDSSTQTVLKIRATNPSTGAKNVAVNAKVSATFSMYINVSSVTTETFKLQSKDGEVKGSVYTNGDTVTFIPSANLAYNTKYTATLTQKIRAANYAGTTLDSNYTWSFTTVSDTSKPNGSISINNGDAYSNTKRVILNLSATDNRGITGYVVSTRSDTPSTSAPDWVSVASTTNFAADIQYILSRGDESKTLYAFYKDVSDNISSVSHASIMLDTSNPDSAPAYKSVVKREKKFTRIKRRR